MKKQIMVIATACIVSVQYAPIRGMNGAYDTNGEKKGMSGEIFQFEMDELQILKTQSAESSAEKKDGMAYGLLRSIAEKNRKTEEQFERKKIDCLTRNGMSKEEAYYDLGCAYEHGHGIPQNYLKALQWYKEAAAQGCCAARLRIEQTYTKRRLGYDIS